SAERAEMALAQEEGAQVTPNVSVEPDASFAPIFEDINIYVLDARLRGVTNSPLLLPPPRSSYESRVDGRYRIHFGNFPHQWTGRRAKCARHHLHSQPAFDPEPQYLRHDF